MTAVEDEWLDRMSNLLALCANTERALSKAAGIAELEAVAASFDAIAGETVELKAPTLRLEQLRLRFHLAVRMFKRAAWLMAEGAPNATQALREACNAYDRFSRFAHSTLPRAV